MEVHWRQWQCTGTSQERFRPGKKRSLFHCNHKQLLWPLWHYSISGVTLLTSVVLLQIYSFSQDALLSLISQLLAWKSCAGLLWGHRKSISVVCYCVTASSESPFLPPVPLRWVIERNHGYECSFTQPHIQYASVELRKRMNFKTFLSSSSVPSVFQTKGEK